MKKNAYILPPAREHCKPYYYNLARVRVRAKNVPAETQKTAFPREKARERGIGNGARKNQVFAAR